MQQPAAEVSVKAPAQVAADRGMVGAIAPAQRARRAFELVVLGVVAPLVLSWLRRRGWPMPVIPVLLVAGAGCWWLLRRAPDFDRAALAIPRERGWQWRGLTLAAVGALALLALAWILVPDSLFDLPRERPRLWLLIVCFYPLVSVLPQELLFRVGFTYRYRALFSSEPAFIAANAASFGLAHLLFGHWISVVLSSAGGWLFARSYLRTRSIWTPAIEHAIYGVTIFSVGLGVFFYAGA